MALSFNSQVRGIWTFVSTLEEEVSSSDFQIVSSGATYSNLSLFDFDQSKNVTQKGLQFVEGVTFDAGNGFDFTHSGTGIYQLLIVFWWYSTTALGQTQHAITKRLTPKVAPILAKATSSTASGIETITAGEWIISEIGYSETQNAIQFAMCEGGGAPTHIFTSEPYLPGLHCIGIVMRPVAAGSDLVNIVIDGKPGTWHFGPATLANGVSDLTLNNVGFGYTAHQTTQTGIIGDLVITSSVYSDVISHPLKYMRFGWQNIVTDESDNLPTFNAIAYDQPSTVTTNQVFTIGENIVAARSDGELVSGARPIWDNVFSFNNPSSVSQLNTSTTDPCPASGEEFDATKKTVCWTEDGLRVQGATVRI